MEAPPSAARELDSAERGNHERPRARGAWVRGAGFQDRVSQPRTQQAWERSPHRGPAGQTAGSARQTPAGGGTRRAGGRPGTNPAATNALRSDREQLGEVLETFPDPGTESRAFRRGPYRLSQVEAGERTWRECGCASSRHQRSGCVHRHTQYRTKHTHTPQTYAHNPAAAACILHRQPHNTRSTYTTTSHIHNTPSTQVHTRITHCRPSGPFRFKDGLPIRLRLLVSLSDSPTLLRFRLFCFVLFSKQKGGSGHHILIWAAESGRRGQP